ncbi:complement C3 [Nothobranchius furzeri]|uniref:Complement C3-like n=2 Tax=Nothobranchius TaxID=28779 RepID=A0A8C6P932_NOTFU|nr:complement C3 [Nothobranchius furzeri]
MGSIRRMCWLQLWLISILAAFCQIPTSAGSPQPVMSAPNLLRVGTEENIFVEIQDFGGSNDVTVTIHVKNFPTKTRTLASTTVTLRKDKNFQDFGRVTIPAAEFINSRANKVSLQAEFSTGTTLETYVLVSFQSGFIFIQTDKPIYNPGTLVQYRVFAMGPGMEPLNNSQPEAITLDVMTPDGIIIQSETVSTTTPMHSRKYKLPNVVSFGQWKVVAKIGSNTQEAFTAEFEVKEYVLPSFEVKITPPPQTPFFYMNSNELTFTITAKYMFGKEVDGTAYVVFGLIQGDSKKSFANSLQRVPIEHGRGEVTLRKNYITSTFGDILALEGKSIYVAASVLTKSGGELVETELRGIKIVKSPYTITFKKTPKYFKPGMSFNVMVEVTNPDDSPASKIDMVLEPEDKEDKLYDTTTANGIARFSVNTVASSQSLTFKVKTNDAKLDSDKQATASMQAYPYRSSNNQYIYMSVNTDEVVIGETMKVDFFFGSHENREIDVTYLILSRGMLISHDRYKSNNQKQFTRMVKITKEMLPSFRIVTYYHTTSNELVSDSVWVDVKDTCMGTLRLEMVNAQPSYEPRKRFRMKITGDPGSTVGMVAVDKSVYVLNNKNRLTQRKIWDVVEQYDTGCTAGGGKDNINVFYDAGLLLQTSHVGTPYRDDVNCSSSSGSRQKRSGTIMEVRATLTSNYENEALKKQCCLDGMRDIPLSYSCERRSEYIMDGSACIEAFLRCCTEMLKHKYDKKEEMLMLSRSLEEDGYKDRNEIISRHTFPESWLWRDVLLPSCPSHDSRCTTKSEEIIESLPDSITTWQLTGVSLSRTLGICVASPVEVTVFKQFFIDLRLPYSAVRGEQLEIKAILHNYSEDPITVRVEIKEEGTVCSAAYKKKWYRQEVQVGHQTTRSVSFIIVPMEHGEVPIEIKASVKNSQVADGIKKMLRVVPQGELTKTVTKVILDPAGKGGKQEETINSDISLIDLAPDTPKRTEIFLTGIEQMSTLLDNAITGESMGTLIRQPAGCGEQNIAAMTLPVIATIFLDKTDQWEMVGMEKRKEAIQHIKTGYTNELAYRKPDGSFAMYPYYAGTTRLTSYVAKVFAMAYNYVAMDPNVICGAIKFIILRAQQPDGMFTEVENKWWNVVGDNKEVTITSLCLISMQESRQICSAAVSSLPNAISKAVTYLERRLPSLNNPYAVAVTSYALANENKLNKEFLLRFASQDRTHWSVTEGKTYTLEATAYALLALVKAEAFEDARPIVRWLGEQQRFWGGYGSTHATILVYQAAAEYAANAREPDYNLNVDIAIQGRSLMEKVNFNSANRFNTRTSKFDGINKDVKVTATGTGEAMFSMVSLYYALPSKQESDCEMFDMTVEILPEQIDEEKSVYKLSIEVLYKNSQRNASMPVLDIGLPTGYIFNKNDLESLSSGHDRFIDFFETENVLSEKGSLVIYLKTISNTRPDEISFRIEQQSKVGILQPAAVSVYEYYNKKRCVKYYRPERRSGELLRLCQGDACFCAEENCSKQRKEKISNDVRTTKACESTESSKIDYIYKVEVEGFMGNFTTDDYAMRILNVFKEGSTDPGSEGQLRTFLNYQHCREALGLTPGKTYLIMGSSSDIYIRGDLLQYVLGENTWVEYWPTPQECQTERYRPTCLGMEELEEQIAVFGCQMK